MMKPSIRTVVSVVTTGMILASCGEPGAPGANITPDDAEDAVRDFYEEAISYEGDPVADEFYLTHPALTASFAESIHANADTTTGPILCTQEEVEDIDVSLIPSRGDEEILAVAIVEEETDSGTLPVYVNLIREPSGWKINAVRCPDTNTPGIPVSSAPSSEDGSAQGQLGGFCGGIAAFTCDEGLTCIDDPNDSCNPEAGGADCGGICVAE